MFDEFKKHINTNFSFLQDKKVLLAVSGGLDSIVLCHLFYQLKQKFSIAHCNFMLRDQESDTDEDFVKKLGNTLGIETFTIKFNTKKQAELKKQSIQITARNLRYDWFNELAKKHHFDFIVTAHHADDNLETFLINLTRGTGIEGLTGIPTLNGKIIRPLLIFSREELKKYAIENKISWREDSSNQNTKYLRNKIRHEIVPILKEINPSLLSSFSTTIHNLKQSKQIINEKVDEIKKDIIQQENDILKINIDKLISYKNYSAYLYEILKEYSFQNYKDINQLLNSQTGKKVVSKTHILLKNRGFLLLSCIDSLEEKNKEIHIDNQTKEIKSPIHLKFDYDIKNFELSPQQIIIDKKLVNFPLILRRWKEGDVFYPSKMKGKKKLSKYFKDLKLSKFEKEKVWLLCSGNEIIWVVGFRQDRRFIGDLSNTALIVKLIE